MKSHIRTQVVLFLLLSLLIGCARTPVVENTQKQSGGSSAAKDDASSIAALESLGAKLKKDGAGNITSADFRGVDVSNEDLGSLSGLKNVRNLDLRDCGVTTAGIPAIEGLTTLKALRFSGKSGKTDITDDAMPSIGKLTNLKVLALDFLKFAAGADGLRQLSKLKNLEELYIGNTLVNDESLEVIAEQFPKLKKLRVAASQVSDEGAKHIAKLSNLEELDISENSLLYDTGLEHLAGMKQLKKLNCYRLQVSGEPLAGLTNLEWLNLDNTNADDFSLECVKDMSKLTFLHLGSNAGITDEGLPLLKHLANLKDLKVTRTGVTADGVAELKKSLKNTAIQLQYIEGK